jgi:leucyl-tRNA---protein transferase
MIAIYSYDGTETSCSYLPTQRSTQRYVMVSELSAEEYSTLMLNGWRRFGYLIFMPICTACSECQSLRVLVNEFTPNTSQKRAIKANADVRLVIGTPEVTEEKLTLYDKYHRFQAGHRGWNAHPKESAENYSESFVWNPYPTQEWCYYVGEKLIGVGYVDAVPAGLSAIYFYYDPDERDRSLGTFNVLRLMQESVAREEEHLYLGYYVKDCQSLTYKANFRPYELYQLGNWVRVER